MNKTIEQIKPETIALIESQARVAGLSIDEYLGRLVRHEHVAERPAPKLLSPEERVAAFEAWAKSHDPNIPALSLEDISRETIY